jgi:hypothetical protein
MAALISAAGKGKELSSCPQTQQAPRTDRDIETVRAVGFDDGAIAEVVAQVALNVFTNYFNQTAGTILDFPKAPAV